MGSVLSNDLNELAGILEDVKNMTPTMLNGKLCMHAAFVNYRTSEQDVKILMHKLDFVAKLIFEENKGNN